MELDPGDVFRGVDAVADIDVPGWDPHEEWDEIPAWDAPAPTAMDLVLESAAMVWGHSADQLKRIDTLRLEALAEAAREGNPLKDVIERSVRLELAAGLSITEAAAGSLMALGEALVHRYPAVLDHSAMRGSRSGTRPTSSRRSTASIRSFASSFCRARSSWPRHCRSARSAASCGS